MDEEKLNEYIYKHYIKDSMEDDTDAETEI